jgi:hypothetical protein
LNDNFDGQTGSDVMAAMIQKCGRADGVDVVGGPRNAVVRLVHQICIIVHSEINMIYITRFDYVKALGA